MTPKQFTDHLARAGFPASGRDDDLGISAFSRWLPCALRTAQAYAAGETPIPAGTAKLLRLMVRLNLKPEDVK